jgi:hypothetical protein
MSAEFDKKLDDEGVLKSIFEDLDKIDAETGSGREVTGAALGAGVGAAASFAALYGLGVTGLSAAGITSGLAAAGALLGGGMVAGVGVLAAPIAILAVGGYAWAKHNKDQRVKQLQRDVLAKAVGKQNEILQKLEKRTGLSEAAVQELRARNDVLVQLIEALRRKGADS